EPVRVRLHQSVVESLRPLGARMRLEVVHTFRRCLGLNRPPQYWEVHFHQQRRSQTSRAEAVAHKSEHALSLPPETEIVPDSASQGSDCLTAKPLARDRFDPSQTAPT